MISRLKFSLTFAILASLASLLLLTWLLLSIISFKTAEKDLLAAKSAHASALLKIIVSTLPSDISTDSLKPLSAALSDEKDFAGLLLVNDKGEAVFTLADERSVDSLLLDTIRNPATKSQIPPHGLQLQSYTPIVQGGKVTGAARLRLSLGGEHARLARSRTLFMGYFILDFILLLGLGAFILRRIIVSPLERLLKATERVIAGDYGHPVHIPASLEISDLAESFNLMQDSLRERRDQVEAHLRSLEAANRALKEARLETIRSEKMASVGLLAAGMAHEIGAPLAAILGYSGILSEELSGDAEKSDCLRRITEDAGRIDRLVRDLLNYARPVKPEIERIDVKEFFDDLYAMLERQGIFKRLEASLVLNDDLPTLYLDRHQLMQVLMNLVMNARDAMPDGGRLRISASAVDNDAVMINVEDSGEGISAENLDRIFDPFFTTKEPGRGTGLGLAISARLVESFGGKIAVESEPGRGTTFRVKLPGVVEA
ncbi:MAG TPA: ATP-binding protein [Geobacteraceae bacterium]|nr:ATP-binding protein [Geobacteraceae bacterium]